ncbi:MAG: polymer-forming cytoskeletal protein [Prevotellaceae bacterium]|jgi:cytoskeletal protein CcmA (bactofilin family)|nr:polymer-forming cytoskeletal protein [Prevotellaceae bacterium]
MAKTNEEPSGGLHNVLATGTVLTGTIVAESDFRLDGSVEGEINCKGKIVIGPKGYVKGNIMTENAEIFGNIDGIIRVRERLILKSSAVIKGDIFIQTLEIEPGAKLNGSCTMSGKEAIAATTGIPVYPNPANVQKK